MHLQTLIAFALVFLHSDGQWSKPLYSDPGGRWTLGLLAGQVAIITLAAWGASRRAVRVLAAGPQRLEAAQRFHHRAMTVLKLLVTGAFALDMLVTPWPDRVYGLGFSAPLKILADLLVLMPFAAGVTAVWWFAYPVDRAMRDRLGTSLESNAVRPVWSRSHFLNFNLRHHVLVIAVPITLILYVSNLTEGYAEAIRRRLFGWPYAPDVLLGAVALMIFAAAPLLLRRIWLTRPLEAGALRRRLETLCERIGMRCREILVWNSDGMMINAAVMGLSPRVRYVLLSDGLLETMDERQIEAVFGHEAGHIRLHHIEFFLMFAFVTMLAVSGAMEALYRCGLSSTWVEVSGGAMAVVVWGMGFGWVSRRFERQADLFGVRCVTPDAQTCRVPCSVHPSVPLADDPPASPGREVANHPHGVCATAAHWFASALDRVAVLNGIPHEERSWRHSSIGSRIRFLMSLANDPNRAAGFDRLIGRIKTTLWVSSVAGAALATYYYVAADPVLLKPYR
ncbi:MAG: hypothetical protein C4547_13035 [Phycisphaerales bacterium]|nr:MAG: hypothetical protein C4547_13035 [Phycisphaerales bacterium]